MEAHPYDINRGRRSDQPFMSHFLCIPSLAAANVELCGRVADDELATTFAHDGAVSLAPLGWVSRIDPEDTTFCFRDVPPGSYTLSVEPRCCAVRRVNAALSSRSMGERWASCR